MKALLIGGTGTISTEISKRLIKLGWELTLLNRGNTGAFVPEGARVIKVDVNDEAAVNALLGDERFDVIADFIVFTPEQAQRDIRLFRERTAQYIFISSASAYQKPLATPVITESTPLSNPYWQYSRNKIAIEELLMKEYRESGFPITIVRPSHTYDERNVPVGAHGDKGSWQVLKRMMEGKPVLVQGDGTTLWTVTFNTDFAKAFIGLMGNIHAIGEAYHITSDESVTWNQIYRIIADELSVPFKPYYVPSDFLHAAGKYDYEGGLIGDKSNTVVFDNSKVKRAVPGFVSTVRADQGLRKTIRHMLATPELQKDDPEFDAWCDKVIAAMEKAKEDILNG